METGAGNLQSDIFQTHLETLDRKFIFAAATAEGGICFIHEVILGARSKDTLEHYHFSKMTFTAPAGHARKTHLFF